MLISNKVFIVINQFHKNLEFSVKFPLIFNDFWLTMTKIANAEQDHNIIYF